MFPRLGISHSQTRTLLHPRNPQYLHFHCQHPSLRKTKLKIAESWTFSVLSSSDSESDHTICFLVILFLLGGLTSSLSLLLVSSSSELFRFETLDESNSIEDSPIKSIVALADVRFQESSNFSEETELLSCLAEEVDSSEGLEKNEWGVVDVAGGDCTKSSSSSSSNSKPMLKLATFCEVTEDTALVSGEEAGGVETFLKNPDVLGCDDDVWTKGALSSESKVRIITESH
ncbi:hypothetical protein Ocin01_07207 [Orchesella cincta]|uniref:Uncharacterized protein n=1 Tax=Orchesella cincta TaxID=48709 RepID=A0A1D2N2H7_ORCCI|nr:hypothetical protein Ocin01_07207 [Orchesella cincta]